MSRALVTIKSRADRNLIANWAERVPEGTRVEFKACKRSLDQNSKFWACVTDVSMQVKWYGQHLRPDEWRYLFLDALKRELKMVPSIDGAGLVNVGRSSSDLSKEEFSDLLELVLMFGAEHGVRFRELEAVA